MFRSTARNLRSWWVAFSDDILGADLPPSVEDAAQDVLDYHRDHPHRQPLGRSRPRRAGAVSARPAHCLSPVRSQEPGTVGTAAASHQLSR